MISTAKSRLYELIESKKSVYQDLADRIWDYAETRFEEKQSAQAICEVLENAGFAVQTEVGQVPHAFIGSFGEGRPIIGFLGEYDALSGLSQKAFSATREPIVPGGNGHGCGHHLLGVGSLAAAIALKEHMREMGIPGTVKYFGCPGEEGGSGKTFMAKAHLFDDLDVAISWHPGGTNTLMYGSSLANIQVYYKFIGKASHAAGSPHLGRSALDAVELMNTGVNYMREHIIPEARVHYAMVNSGGKSPNVVQPEAEVLYLIRAPKNSQVQELYQWVSDIAKAAAMMTQTQVRIQVDKACSNLIPNQTLEQIMYENLAQAPLPIPTQEELDLASAIRDSLTSSELESMEASLIKHYGERQGRELYQSLKGQVFCTAVLPYKTDDRPSMGSSDVADVSWIAPTVQCYTSCYALGTPGHSWQLVSQGLSGWAHKGMLLAAKVMAGTALDLLNHLKTIEEAKKELRERLGDQVYTCPIPDGVKPSPVK